MCSQKRAYARGLVELTLHGKGQTIILTHDSYRGFRTKLTIHKVVKVDNKYLLFIKIM